MAIGRWPQTRRKTIWEATDTRITAYTNLALAQETNEIEISDATPSSIFYSPTRDLAFALNIPEDTTTEDLYFTLQVPAAITWGAVGLGSNTMAGALILMTYPSASGQNVTLSPRLAKGHSEPVYAPEIQVEALPGTGLVNETTYVYNGRCGNCREWAGGKGSIDVKSTTQSMLYATGETGDTRSDDPAYSVGLHYNYGTFAADLVRATGGSGSVPDLRPSGELELVGATPQGKLAVEGRKDRVATAHALVMVFCFVGLLPFGTLILRLGGWVRWHAANQGLALVLVIVGFGTGVATSRLYNRVSKKAKQDLKGVIHLDFAPAVREKEREANTDSITQSKNFNSAHQVIGILVFAFVLIQFGLGFMHHRTFKKTQQTTKMAPIHVWLGRLIMLLGVINGFLYVSSSLTF